MSRYAMVHTSCHEVSFFYKELHTKGQPLRTELALYPDGRIPAKGQPVKCHHCGETLLPDELLAVYEDIELPRARHVIMVDLLHMNQRIGN